MKKLVKYESSPRESTEIHIQAGPTSINIERLFEHTIASKTKQKEKPKDEPKTQQRKQTLPSTSQPHRTRPETIREDIPIIQRPCSRPCQRPVRVRSAEAVQQPSRDPVEKTKPTTLDKKKQKKPEEADKENIPEKNVNLVKSKMWIRPKSGSQVRKPAKKTDPVSLYQAYQKDWEKFKPNICESSHADLRWSIREKMMGNR